MAQWGQGYQYPMQTGFNPQQQQFQQLAPQPTGFPGQRPGFQQPQQTGFPGQQGFQQPQQTGFPGQQGFQQPQQTGFPGQQLQPQQTGFPGSNFQQRPPPPPVPPIPSQFQQQAPPPPPPPQNVQNSGFLSAQQPNRFLNSSPGLTPLAAQPTGFPGGGGLRPLMPQATGFVDPRLQMMSNTFLPANTSSPYNAAGMPQFQQQQSGFSLQQSFQEHNQAQRGNAAPKIPWALSKAEKKSYDQIFRAWDAGNTGFISGQTALEVFGQSGLDRNDLAKIWALADVENRGKLNLAEFHVAMGLIYRRLNGNEIPDVLPPELVPPSARDLEESVNVLRDILKNDTRARSPAGLENVPESRMRERSFYSNTAGAGGRQDATVYKYKDETPAGGFYQPRSRHVDRSAIRTTSESASPSADLDDMKRQLENTAKMLDRVADENASRTAEDDALEREMSDLKYRVKRVQEDLEYVSRGPRSVAKDEERRKLERELLELMHDKLPDLERRIKDREERREREKREWARERDRRNERFGRYDDRDDRYSSRYDRDRDPYDRPRSAYDRDDRDRERDRDRDYRDRDRDYDRDRDRDRPYSRNRDRDYDRPRSPPTARSPPPPPPEPSTTTSRPPPPAPTPSTAAATKKALTPEERSALARQRIQERMAALGVVAPSPSPKIDTSVEDRLAQEKKEAEEKAKAAEREAEERERIRRERLEGEKALKEGRSPTSPGPSASSIPSTASQVPTPKPTPPPAPAAKPQPPAPPAPRVKPPVPQKRGPAPPPPASRGSAAARAPPAPAPPAAPTPPAAPAPPPAPAVDPEEEALRAREEALRKQREERLARLRALEQEEEEARRQEEARRRQLLEQRTPVVSPPAPPVAPPAPPAPEPQQVPAAAAPPPPPPPPPPAPPAPSSHASTPSVDKSTTNPFSRLMKESPGSGAASPATPGGGSSTNPFFKAQAASPPAAAPAAPPPPPAPPAPAAPPAPPAPSKSPAPPAVRTAYHTAPGDSEDDWEEVQEKDEDDSSDDELDSSRDTRSKLAQQLFGSILPPSRPQSAAPAATTKSTGTPEPSSPAPPPPPPPPPSAPPMANNIPVGIPAPPPPPPGAPPAPAAPAAPVAAPAPTGDRSALLSAIQSGARLRKTQTNDRSAAPVSGRVIGDATPPPHVSAAPRLPSPPASAPALAPEPEAPHPPPMESVRSSNRESVDWYAGLAAEVQRGPSEQLPTTMEEEEPEPATPVPQIQVNATDESNALADVDMGTEYRVRSLYAYQAQRPEELSFSENLILTAHPSKSGSDWWYGTIVRDGKSGFFPKTYVEQVTSGIAHAIYDYNGSNADELPFSEGDELHIVDKSDADWWKAEQGGVVFIVPAAYLALADAAVPVQATPKSTDSQPANGAAHAASHHQTSVEVDGKADPAESSDDDNSSDSGSDYVTATDSDSDADDSDDDEEEQSEEARKQERQARAAERQRVLEAAGLIIKKESQPPPRPARTRSHRRRRPAPAVPPRSPQIPSSPLKELPPVPESESANNSLRLDDAFERYEAYRQNHLALNRLSVASFESGTSTTSPQSSTFTIGPPPSLSTSASTSEEPRSHGFLSFFNRSRTPANDGETRTMPVISAPILQREPSPAPGEGGDSAFGSSWASLVDKSALEEIPTTERRRQEAIFELIVTEAAYVRDLQLIVEHFYANVYSLLDEKARTVIFANVEDILLMNTTFLSSLEERQKDCRLYIDKIGDILKTNMANLGVYMDYCVNQATAIKVLQSLRQTNPELSASLQRLRDDPAARNLDLSSYLLVPMQRITRYPLLFKQIIHYTDEGDDRSQIESSRQMAEKVLAHINETIRDQEGRERLKEVSKDLWVGQGRLDLTAPTRYMGPRKLLKEGVLMKAKSGRKLRAFLCSDILVLTEEASKSLYRMPLSLAEVEVRESTGGKDDATFQLAVTYPRGGDEVTLRAATPRESQAWMQAIHTAAKRSRDAQRRAARKSRG